MGHRPAEPANPPADRTSTHLVQRVVIGVVEGLGELLHLEHRRLAVRPGAVGHGDGHLVAERAGVGGQVLALADRVLVAAQRRTECELGGICGGGAPGEHGDAAGHHEAPEDLTGGRVPQPVTHLGVEGVVLAAAPHGRLVVEAVEVLAPVIDRPEGLHRDLLAVGGAQHLPFGVREGGVQAAFGFPLTHQCPQGAPFVAHACIRSSEDVVELQPRPTVDERAPFRAGMALDEQKYILLTSFRRDGTPASGGTAHRWARRCGSCPSKTAGSGSGPARDRARPSAWPTPAGSPSSPATSAAGSPTAPARRMPPHSRSPEPTTRRSSRRSGPSTASCPRRRSSSTPWAGRSKARASPTVTAVWPPAWPAEVRRSIERSVPRSRSPRPTTPRPRTGGRPDGQRRCRRGPSPAGRPAGAVTAGWCRGGPASGCPRGPGAPRPTAVGIGR